MRFAHDQIKTLALAFGLALAAPAAFAQAFDAVRLYGAAPGQDGGTVGAAVVAGYEYPGSAIHRTLVIPVLDYQWANGWFAGVANGVGYNFSDSPQMQYGLRLTVDKGRKESHAGALHGMGNVDPAAEGGAFLNYSPTRGLYLTSSLRLGAGRGNKGLLVDLGAARLAEIAPRWHLVTGASITLANADYLQSYFGVTGAQAAATGYATHAARAGARDARANAALTYSFDPTTSVTTALSTSALLGAARSSPITRRRTSTSAVVAVAHAF